MLLNGFAGSTVDVCFRSGRVVNIRADGGT